MTFNKDKYKYKYNVIGVCSNPKCIDSKRAYHYEDYQKKKVGKDG